MPVSLSPQCQGRRSGPAGPRAAGPGHPAPVTLQRGGVSGPQLMAALSSTPSDSYVVENLLFNGVLKTLLLNGI